MDFISKEALAELREKYKPGTRVVLRRMEDLQAPPLGTCGTVRYVDDIGSLGVAWDNGSSLSVAYGEDYVEIIPDEEEQKMPLIDDKVFEQTMAIRESGVCNMLSVKEVQYYANERQFYDLVCFIEDYPSEFFHFILTGDRGEEK